MTTGEYKICVRLGNTQGVDLHPNLSLWSLSSLQLDDTLSSSLQVHDFVHTLYVSDLSYRSQSNFSIGKFVGKLKNSSIFIVSVVCFWLFKKGKWEGMQTQTNRASTMYQVYSHVIPSRSSETHQFTDKGDYNQSYPKVYSYSHAFL